MKNFRSSIFSSLWLGETSWMLAGKAIILIPKELVLQCLLQFSLWEDADWETRDCFLLPFFCCCSLTAKVGKLAVTRQQSH